MGTDLKFVLCAAVAAVVAASAARVRASDVLWSGGNSANANFSSSLNWFQLDPPGSNDTADFSPSISATTLFRSTVVVDDIRTVGSLTIAGSFPFSNWEFQHSGTGSLTVLNSTKIAQDNTGFAAIVIFNGLKLGTVGTTTVDTASLTVGTNSVISSGTFLTKGSASLEVDSTSQLNGFLDASAFSTVAVNNTGSFIASGLKVHSNARVSVNSGGTISLKNNGTITDAGELDINAGGHLSFSGASELFVGSGGVGRAGELTFVSGYQMPANVSLVASGGGKILSELNLDVGDDGAATLLCDGTGSTVSALANTSFFGIGGPATITFSNGGAGTFSDLGIAPFGSGAASLSVSSGGTFTVNSLAAGGGGLATITVHGGTFISNGTSNFFNGAAVTVNDDSTHSGAFQVNGLATFLTGSTYNGTPPQIGNGALLTFQGTGTFTNGTGGVGTTAIGSGGELDVTGAGTITDINQLVLGGTGAGLLDVSDPGSNYINTGPAAQIGQATGTQGYLSVSNSGAASFSAGLNLATGGGSASVSVYSGGTLNTGTILAGSTTAGANALVLLQGGALIAGASTFSGGSSLMLFSGAATFSNGVSLVPGAGTALINVAGGTFFCGGSGLTAGGASANAATLNIAGGLCALASTATFANKSTVNLSSGTLDLTTNAFFNAGSTLNWSGGALTQHANATLVFDASTGSVTASVLPLSNSATITLQDGAQLTCTGRVDIGNTADAGTIGALNVNGPGTKYIAAADGWGRNPGDVATINFNLGGVGTLSGATRLGAFGGHAALTINDASTVNNIGSLVAGGAATSVATITVSNISALICTGTSQFSKGAVLNDNATVTFNSNATFSSGSTFNYNSTSPLGLGTLATLTFDGGVGSITQNFSLPSGGVLQVINQGQVNTFNGTFGVANGVASGTVLVDSGSTFSVLGPFFASSQWGTSTGNNATVTLSNNSVGTVSPGLGLSTNGGRSVVSVLNGAKLTIGTLAMGSTGANATLTINGGSLNVTGTATVNNGAFLNLLAGSLTVNGTLTVNGGGSLNDSSQLVRTGGLSINGNGIIDLAPGNMIVSNTSLSTMKGYLTSGYGGGLWIGSGIACVPAFINPSHNTALGYASAGSIGLSSFAGQSVNPTDTLIRYTYYGDANLDGKVNALDFNALATNFGNSSKFWSDGDFNFDGMVNTQDFTALAGNFNAAALAPTLGSLVPEPSVSLAVFAGVSLLASRLRNRGCR